MKSCHLLCRRSITSKQLDDADNFLIEFCQIFEQLYGQEYCTMNIHLHGHVKECIRDFGPVYAFWLFSFERLNGVLGSYHTNCHDISLQLMRRFIVNHEYGVSNWPEEYRDEFDPLLSKFHYNKGSLSPEPLSDSIQSNNVKHALTKSWLQVIGLQLYAVSVKSGLVIQLRFGRQQLHLISSLFLFIVSKAVLHTVM